MDKEKSYRKSRHNIQKPFSDSYIDERPLCDLYIEHEVFVRRTRSVA